MTDRRVGVAFDFASIPCLLAFKPTCALADEASATVEWLPCPSPKRPSSLAAQDGSEETVAERHRRVRAAYFANDNARYARWQGIALRRDGTGVDTGLVHAACLFANRHGVGRAFLERVWPAFWANELDIERQTELTHALEAVGARGFDAADARSALTAHIASLAEEGVFNVPTYLVRRERFLGRAHLPMIRRLLS